MSLGTSAEIEKKRKRMELNRESARRSRLKKEKRIQDLTNEIAKLKLQILEGNQRCNDTMQKVRVLLSENESLKSKKETLDHHLGKLLFFYSSFRQKKQIGCSSNQQWQATGPQKSTVTTGMSKSLDLLF